MARTVILGVAALAAYYDVRCRRVPNWLSASLAVAALASHTLSGGSPGLAASATGLVVPLVLLFPLFAIRALGAGDVKFSAALGAALSWPLVPQLLIGTALVAGAIAIVDVVRRRQVLRTAGNLLRFPPGLPTIDSPGALLVPFTLASAVATWWILLWPRS